jgi:quinol-cytochrome oxidoreductase complex cytochrome b subunit
MVDFNKKPIDPKMAKQVVEQTATKTVEVTIGVFKWIFIVLIVYISIITVWGYIAAGDEFLTNIATISVGGFWGFLFGYFGWRIGQSIEEFFNKRFRKNKDS